MRQKSKYFLGLFFILSFLQAQSQYYLNGQDPASVQWQQIKTPSATFIFPKEASVMAQRYANLLQLSYHEIAAPYLMHMRPIIIVLHNRSTLSNAMVSPTPMHADFFLTPDQTTYAQRWSKQLTLHEYRHAVQMQKLQQGTTKVLYYAFGDQAIGAMMGLFLPFWFIEGDAVFSETIHSKSGRGRSPDFVMDLKAQVLENGIYSYDKAQYGSYRDYVPDHYTLGYQLVLNGHLTYGNQIWDQTLDRVARKPYTITPFSTGIKRFAGIGKTGYYQVTMQQLKTEWELSDSSDNTKFLPQPEFNNYTNYRFLQTLKNGSILAEKTSLNDINRFIMISPDGAEKILKTPGYDFTQSLSGNDSLLVWNEKAFDIRWSNCDYSVIKVFYIKSGKTQTLTQKSKLFAPSLSHNSSTIAAIKVDTRNRYTLQLLNRKTGQVVNDYSTPENWFLMSPSWADDDQSIVLLALGDQGKAIIQFHISEERWDTLTPFSFVDISYPILNHEKLVFKGAYDGTNNLYCKDLSTKKVTKLTDSRFGASDPDFSYSGDSLLFVDYTSNGYRLAGISLIDTVFKEVELDKVRHHYPIDILQSEDQFILDDLEIPDTLYPVEKYSRLGHLFNFHSWGLAAVDLENYSFAPGVNLLSQNVLSTSVAQIGYYYDPNEQTGKFKAGFDYLGWYPVIKLSAETGRRKQLYTDDQHQQQEARWRETDMTAGVSLPLNLTNSCWIKGIEPYTGISAKFLSMDKDMAVSFREDQVTSISHSVFAYIQYKRSLRDLFPKWGQSLQLNYRYTPFSDSVSRQLAIISTTYIPGIINHHGIRLYAGYQWIDNGNYAYSNLVSQPRGYSGISLTDMFFFKADYAFPVAYPDWDIPSVLYLKRISSHIFYDIAAGENIHKNPKTYTSTGVEVFTDWHFLGLLPEITLGGRGSYRFYDDKPGFEILFGVSF